MKKARFCQILYNRGKTERDNHMFTPARDLLAEEETQMPDSSDNNKKGDGIIYLAVDEKYH